ncbi:hypothetical protein DEO72_LG3g1538 [Vigna unguiculata]|uniref:Secreted protein n=1 Tax=Vigna unguiculata TaxID=3917 RepID=A0A4D6LEK6_VIGUN|nr:hypothetical protein DEO72_LG3g1538 [Vigna unguiculata]
MLQWISLGRISAAVRDVGTLLAMVACCEGGDCHGYYSEVQVFREDALVQAMVAALLLQNCHGASVTHFPSTLLH